MTIVTKVPAASPDETLAYFSRRLRFETDCWDVNDAMAKGRDFVLVDTRSPDSFARTRLPNAVNIPYATMTQERMAEYPRDTLFVVYCNGPHCNGATRAAVRLAGLGRPVKEMIGGAMGWLYSGFDVLGDDVAAARTSLEGSVGTPHACTI